MKKLNMSSVFLFRCKSVSIFLLLFLGLTIMLDGQETAAGRQGQWHPFYLNHFAVGALSLKTAYRYNSIQAAEMADPLYAEANAEISDLEWDDSLHVPTLRLVWRPLSLLMLEAGGSFLYSESGQLTDYGYLARVDEDEIPRDPNHPLRLLGGSWEADLFFILSSKKELRDIPYFAVLLGYFGFYHDWQATNSISEPAANDVPVISCQIFYHLPYFGFKAWYIPQLGGSVDIKVALSLFPIVSTTNQYVGKVFQNNYILGFALINKLRYTWPINSFLALEMGADLFMQPPAFIISGTQIQIDGNDIVSEAIQKFELNHLAFWVGFTWNLL